MNFASPQPSFFVSAAERLGAPSARKPDFEPAATPVAFGECFGYLHQAEGDVGVLFCGAWGYEALCVHRACAEFAEILAGAGYPTLRFDYPGAGNSASDLVHRRLEDWIEATVSAAARLRELTGVRRIVLAGFGLGALVATAAAERVEHAGLLLLAPPQSGRRYLRETQALAVMVASPGDGGETVEAGAVSIAGFVMPAAFAAEVRALDPTRRPLAADGFALLCAKAEVDLSALSQALGAQGGDVREVAFDGYDDLVVGPIMAKSPRETFRRLAGALAEICPTKPVRLAPRGEPQPAVLVDEDWVEQAVRFCDGRLFGVLCTPRLRAEPAPVALIVNVGRNSHIGWRRMPVENARMLARRGIASLRFDIGGIGESVARPGQPEQILYSDWPVLDMVEAIDFLQARDFGPITIVGVCSGAFIGLQTAIADSRVAGLVDVNLYRLVWDPAESVERALRFGNRPIGAAVTRMLTADRLRKIAAGQVDLRPAISHLTRRCWRAFGVKIMNWFGPIGPRGALYAECMRRFSILRERRIETAFCYSTGDEGLKEIHDYFGPGGRKLQAYPNVRLAVIENCDHNLSPPHAASWLLAQIEEVVARTQHRRAQR